MAKKKFDVEKVMMAAAGGGAARVVQGFAHKFMPGMSPLIDAGGMAVVGGAISYFLPKQAEIGYGMIGAAAYVGVDSFADTALPLNGVTKTAFAASSGRDGKKMGKLTRKLSSLGIRSATGGGASTLRNVVSNVAQNVRGCGDGGRPSQQLSARPAYAEVRPGGNNTRRMYYC